MSVGETSSFCFTPNPIPLDQHLPQVIDFLWPDALVLEEVQDELLMRILKKTTHQMPDLRPRRLFFPTSGVYTCARPSFRCLR